MTKWKLAQILGSKRYHSFFLVLQFFAFWVLWSFFWSSSFLFIMPSRFGLWTPAHFAQFHSLRPQSKYSLQLKSRFFGNPLRWGIHRFSAYQVNLQSGWNLLNVWRSRAPTDWTYSCNHIHTGTCYLHWLPSILNAKNQLLFSCYFV